MDAQFFEIVSARQELLSGDVGKDKGCAIDPELGSTQLPIKWSFENMEVHNELCRDVDSGLSDMDSGIISDMDSNTDSNSESDVDSDVELI